MPSDGLRNAARHRRPGRAGGLIAAALLLAGGAELTPPGPAAAQVLRPPAWVHFQGSSLRPTWESMLFAQLQAADRRWIPRVQRLPGGRIRYIYPRRRGEPPLSAAQAQALLRNPPTFRREQTAIRGLLQQLRRLGVQVILSSPRKPGAAGEWDPAARSIRIRPDIASLGSRQFHEVLNHEAIHVAQSCRAGGVSSTPTLLGLPRRVDPSTARKLRHPAYSRASPTVLLLEQEAYANQHIHDLGSRLLVRHCRRTALRPTGRLVG